MKKGETKDRLKEALNLRGMKQSELVEKTGIDKGQISSYIAGKYSPKQNNLYLIAKALSVDEAWLMGYDVAMERKDDKDIHVIKFETLLDEAVRILEHVGYQVSYPDHSNNGVVIIKDNHGILAASLPDHELVSRYRYLQKKDSIEAELLLKNDEQVFLSYIDSLGYHLTQDDNEHIVSMYTDNFTCQLEYSTLESLKADIDSYIKATIDAELLHLREEELRKERLQKEQIVQLLKTRSQKAHSVPADSISEQYLEVNAAHERTDIDVTDEMRQHDDDIMDDPDF